MVHPPDMMTEPNLTEYHRDPGLGGGGLKDYHHAEYNPYGPHPSLYHHGMGGHPSQAHMMGPGPSTSAFCAPPPSTAGGTPMPGQHDLGGKWRRGFFLSRTLWVSIVHSNLLAPKRFPGSTY